MFAIKRDVWKHIRFADNIPKSEDKDFALRALKSDYEIVTNLKPQYIIHMIIPCIHY
jgi:hypothetical protein